MYYVYYVPVVVRTKIYGTRERVMKLQQEDTVTLNKTVTIVVNGRETVIPASELSPDGELTFNFVVGLSFDPIPSGPYIVIDVTYRNGAGRPPEGKLDAGQRVKIQDGTVFIVTYTDKS